MSGHEPQRHLAVVDCNVYLDVADLLDAPFTWEKFDRRAAALARVPLPHPDDKANDSLRALAVSTSGSFAGDEPLEVWTSSHISGLVEAKAAHPSEADPGLRYRGLGWSPSNARALVTDLVSGLVERSGGGSIDDNVPDGNPPLDHEDGMVFGACRVLAGQDPLARTYCVTRDGGFLAAYRNARLPSHTVVLTPAQFVALVRRARHSHSIRAMKPPT